MVIDGRGKILLLQWQDILKVVINLLKLIILIWGRIVKGGFNAEAHYQIFKIYHLNKGDDAATSEQVKGYLDYLSDNKKKIDPRTIKEFKPLGSGMGNQLSSSGYHSKKYEYMLNILHSKFHPNSKNSGLNKKLMKTGKKYIIEHQTPANNEWGESYGRDHRITSDKSFADGGR